MAGKVLAKRKDQIAEGRFLDVQAQSKVIFNELAKLYMEYARTNKRSLERDGHSIKRLLSRFAGRKLSDVLSLALEEYKAARLKEVTPATVNRELACLKHMFTKAIQWNLASSNPVKTIRMIKERNTWLRYLSSDEIEQLLDSIDARFKPVVVTALYNGMRRGEILGLKWTEVDTIRGLIFIRDSKNGNKRELPLASHLLAQMRLLPHNGDFVFDPEGGYSIRSLRSTFGRALRKAEIEDFTFHDIRHTFASHLVMSGVNLLTVKELKGIIGTQVHHHDASVRPPQSGS